MTGFLDLPFEVRHEIYKLHYKSLLLQCKDKDDNKNRKKPKPPNLALQRTCRTVHAEVKDMWLGLVEFSFGDLRSMLDRLTPLVKKKRNAIRKMTITTGNLKLKIPPNRYIKGALQAKISVVDAFALLPGLKLDVLTVDFRRCKSTSILASLSRGWCELALLLSKPRGWNQLHCYPSKSMINYLLAGLHDRLSAYRQRIADTCDRIFQGKGTLEGPWSDIVLNINYLTAPLSLHTMAFSSSIAEEFAELIQLLEESVDDISIDQARSTFMSSQRNMLIIAERNKIGLHESALSFENTQVRGTCASVIGRSRARLLTWKKIKEAETEFLRRKTEALASGPQGKKRATGGNASDIDEDYVDSSE